MNTEKPTPDEVLREYDSEDPKLRQVVITTWAHDLAEALREAIKQRDQAQQEWMEENNEAGVFKEERDHLQVQLADAHAEIARMMADKNSLKSQLASVVKDTK